MIVITIINDNIVLNLRHVQQVHNSFTMYELDIARHQEVSGKLQFAEKFQNLCHHGNEHHLA